MRIIALIFAIITGMLSNWQFKRLEWKLDLISHINNNYNAPILSTLENIDEFRQIKLIGTWIHTPLFLQYKIHKGDIGCQVVLPFKANKDTILVNLGWQKSCKKIQIPLPELAQGILKRFLQKPEGTAPNTHPNEYYYLNETDMKKIFNLTTSYYIDSDNSLPTLPNNHLVYAFTWLILSILFVFISLFLFLRKAT